MKLTQHQVNQLELLYQTHYNATEASLELRIPYPVVRWHYSKFNKLGRPKLDRYDLLPLDIRTKYFPESVHN